MRKIKIITDSTSDLTKELHELHDIEVLPLHVTIGGKTYKDGEDITVEQIYKLVEKYNELPKSSAISPAQFDEAFQKYISQDYDIIFMGIGSGFSGTLNNARIAAERFPKNRIFLVDSNNLSSGTGLLLLKATDYRAQGLNASEISKKINELTPFVRTQFGINTLEFLHKGGRCSGMARIFGTFLKLKPIIRVIDGKMEVTKKPRGKFSVALDVLLDYFDMDSEKVDKSRITVTHSLADEDAVYLITELKNRGFENIIETRAGATISTHCGPRTIGILYMVHE